MTQERFFELVYAWKDGDLTGDELYKRVFVLSNVVGRSEQLKAEVFTLANKLALAGEGDAAVAMHRIHNRL